MNPMLFPFVKTRILMESPGEDHLSTYSQWYQKIKELSVYYLLWIFYMLYLSYVLYSSQQIFEIEILLSPLEETKIQRLSNLPKVIQLMSGGDAVGSQIQNTHTGVRAPKHKSRADVFHLISELLEQILTELMSTIYRHLKTFTLGQDSSRACVCLCVYICCS